MPINIIQIHFKKTKAIYLSDWQTRFFSIAINLKINLVQNYYKIII